MVPDQSPVAAEGMTPIQHWEIKDGPSHWSFVSCCVDPYPIPGASRRTVQFTAKNDCMGERTAMNAEITTLHVPSLDTWRFEADVEIVTTTVTSGKIWKHVCGKYSTKTRRGFFYYEEEK